MTLLMSILVSCLVGSDSQLPDTSYALQHKNSVVLDGSRESSICWITIFFFSVIFMAFNWRNIYHKEIILKQVNANNASVSVTSNPDTLAWISFPFSPPYHLTQFFSPFTTLHHVFMLAISYFLSPIQFQCDKYLEWAFSKIWIYIALC